MTNSILQVRDLAVSFHTANGEFDAVKGINFELNAGETLAILGESGSGKSVSASTIMGILDSPPGYIKSGEALFEGQNLFEMSKSQRRNIMGDKIAMIFQDTLAHLNPVYSIGWQIAECYRIHRDMTRKEAWNMAVEMLQKVHIPNAEERANYFPHQFSGGQRQRIMIAMALALEPKILFADEPTTALDVTVQAQILDLLIELRNESNMGLILITHDLGVAAEVADRMLVMNHGEIVEHGSVQEIFTAPKHAYTQRLIGSIPGLRKFHELDENAQDDRIPILEVKELTKHYGKVKACDGVTFKLYKSETVGIVGESGSGKTTVTNMLLKITEPTSGSAHFHGKDILDLGKDELLYFRRRFQIVFQDPFASLNPTMNVFQIISEPWEIHNGILPKEKYRERVLELLDQVGLVADHIHRYPHEFSGGQRQRIAIARALALEPEVIVCDEAVSALDVSVQAQIIKLLVELRDRLGLSYLFIAHDLPVVRELADRVIVMKDGKIVEQGTVKQVFTNPQKDYTKELLSANPTACPEQMTERRQRRGVGL